MMTLENLQAIKENVLKSIELREGKLDGEKKSILVCGGTGCTSSNSMKIIDELNNEIKKQGLEDNVNVIKTGCFGLCALGPIMIVYPEGSFYSRVSPEDIPEIVVTQLPSNSVRPARTLFLKVKVLSVPVSGKRIVNMARVSTVKWNLKEA